MQEESGEGAADGDSRIDGVGDALKGTATSLHRCREVDQAYEKLNKIDEGTYGVVYRARCRRSDKIVALKQVFFLLAHRRLSSPSIIVAKYFGVVFPPSQ